jgi:arabinosyltransferase C
VVQVLDPATASTLPLAAGLPAPAPPVGFVPGAGYYTGNRPQGPAANQVWGSLVMRDARGPERNDGQMTTGWYTLPQGLTGGAAVTVLAAGTLENGNTLTAVYGRRSDADVAVIKENEDTEAEEQQSLTDTAHSTSWRTFTLQPPAGADVVRLEAVDGTGGLHGWLAFSAPAVMRPVVLSAYLPDSAPVALAWPLAFAYPCQRQPKIVDGITEAPQYAVLWGDEALSGLDDGTWVPFRGGAFAQVPRTQSVQQLAVVPGVDPNIQVYAFRAGLARAAYTVSETRRTVSGASIDIGTGVDPNG